MSSLANRIAIITGASAGIGESIARSIVAAGAKVVLNARREDKLSGLVASLGAANAAAVAGDAADQSVINELLDVAKHRFGGGKREADLIVVNAGRGLRGSVYDSDDSQWEEVIRINLLGAARLMKSAAERMAGPVATVKGPPQAAQPPTPPEGWLNHPRDIILLGSTVGRHISPFSSMYGSTKAGVHMLAESLRRLMAPRGVRVTLLEPGIVKSEFQDAAGYDRESFGKFMDGISPVLTPEDIARLVMFIVTQPAGMHVCDVMVRPTRQEYP